MPDRKRPSPNPAPRPEAPVRAERFRAALQTRVLGRAGLGDAENFRALILEKGEAALRDGDELVLPLAGPVMGWIPWRDGMRLELGAGAQGTHLLLGASTLDRVLQRRAEASQLRFMVERSSFMRLGAGNSASDAVAACFTGILAETLRPGPMSAAVVESLLHILLVHLHRNLPAGHGEGVARSAQGAFQPVHRVGRKPFPQALDGFPLCPGTRYFARPAERHLPARLWPAARTAHPRTAADGGPHLSRELSPVTGAGRRCPGLCRCRSVQPVLQIAAGAISGPLPPRSPPLPVRSMRQAKTPFTPGRDSREPGVGRLLQWVSAISKVRGLAARIYTRLESRCCRRIPLRTIHRHKTLACGEESCCRQAQRSETEEGILMTTLQQVPTRAG